jgi:glycosyltransferase involved in cell wall biosynthesis
MRDEYLRNHAPRVHALPLFPTVELPSPGEPPGGEPRVVFVGRMTTLKGGDLLIRAAARAGRALGRPIPLDMVGDGPQREAWQALALRLGQPARFTGWLDPAARDRVVAAASLAALPSVWPEPFGLAGLEAAALGLPAVAFDVGGIGEWLRDGVNGCLAPGRPPRARGLAEALLRALGDLERLRAGALAAAAEMSLERHLDRLEAVFREAA